MKIKVKGKELKFSIFRIILLVLCIYLFSLTCPFWYNKAQVILASGKNITWIPKEVKEKAPVWGNTISPNNNLLIIPYGDLKFTTYYDTNIYSMSGFWSAIPNVSFSDENHMNYELKTIEPNYNDGMPESAIQRGKVSPYLDISIHTDKELLHKIIKVNAEMELEYPSKVPLSWNFEYLNSNVKREFYLYFVSPDELVVIKNHFKKDLPEKALLLYLIGFVSVILLLLIIINLRSIIIKTVRELMKRENKIEQFT